MDAHDLTPGSEACPCCRMPDCDHRSHILMLEQRIASLEEDKARLSAWAEAFGELADRLNERLREKWRRRAHAATSPGSGDRAH